MTNLSALHQNSIIDKYTAQLSILLDFLILVKGMSRGEAMSYAQSLRPSDKDFNWDDEDLIRKAMYEEFKQLSLSTHTYRGGSN